MSSKRQATTELNHENWDQDDPSEHEDMGTFKSAPKDILEKRVIRTAKRRVHQASGDESKKSVFSGFGGFNKTQPSSFDFLANLTNGNKSNGTAMSKSDTPVSSGPFSTKPGSSGINAGLFSMPVTSSPTSKPAFGGTNVQSSSLFGGSTSSTSSSPFAISKVDATAGDNPFKIQTTSIDTNTTDTFKNTNVSSSSPFGTNKSLFSNNNMNSSPFNISNTFTHKPVGDGVKNSDDKEEKKLKYYAKLKGLNESVSDWIKKHVEETPLCILSPIFKDYENYLKEIQDEYQNSTIETKKSTENTPETKSPVKKAEFTNNHSGSSLFSSSSDSKPSIFGKQAAVTSGEKSSGFSFGINTASSSATTTTSPKFSFGINTAAPQTTMATSSPFTLPTNTAGTDSTAPTAPFSFGTGKPFSFSSNVQKPENETKEEEDEPPKVEFTPVVEENSVFDKRCKVFVKKDGNFVDKGLGTLYIKKIEESGKHQLLVRANTNLGTILLNLIMSSGIPTQRLGKNNVMLVCIPTPDAKPPPTPILIRVKTSEEADELLETLNKYKA